MKNNFKRGNAENPIALYWFIMILLVSTGVVAMVFVAYSKPMDIRHLEAKIFVNKIADCLSPSADIFREELILNYDESTFLNECNFSLDNEDWTKSSYGFSISLTNFLDNSLIKSVSGGNIHILDFDLVQKKFLTYNFYVSSSAGEYFLAIKVVNGKNV